MRIEDFIQQHRAAFEKAQPGSYTWQNLERTLDRLQVADTLESSLILDRVLLDTAVPAPHIWGKIEATLLDLECQDIEEDKLECFVRTHRAEFDTATPDLRIWEGIAKVTPQVVATQTAPFRVTLTKTLLRIAAAIALLITGATAGIMYKNQSDTSLANTGMRLRDVSNEYAEVEDHYQRDIADKQAKMTKFASNPISNDVQTDIAQMDIVMKELQTELANVPPGNREQVVRAMIENYKAKSSILEKVLEGLEQEQNFKNSPLPSGHNNIKHEKEQI